jgi:hypothetical protein
LQQGHVSQLIFKGLKAFLGYSSNPSVDVLSALFESAGGEIVSSISHSADLLLFGGNDDAVEWINITEKEIKKGKASKNDISHDKVEALEIAFELASDKKVFTFRYICDCIEEGKKLKADAKSNHLVTLKGSNTLPKNKEKNAEKKGVQEEKVEGLESLIVIDSKLTMKNEKKIAAVEKGKEIKDKGDRDGDMKKGVKVDKRRKVIVERGVNEEDEEEQISIKGRKKSHREVDDVEREQEGKKCTKEIDNIRKKVTTGSNNTSQIKGQSTLLVDDSTFEFPIEQSPAEKTPIKAGRLTRKSISNSSLSPLLSQPSHTQNEVAGILITKFQGKESRKRPIQTVEKSGSREKEGKENSSGNKGIIETKNKSSKLSNIHDESKNKSASSSKREVAEKVEDDDEDEDDEEIDNNASPNW